MAARHMPRPAEPHRRLLFAGEKSICGARASKTCLLPLSHHHHRVRSSSASRNSRSLGATAAGNSPCDLRTSKKIGSGAPSHAARVGLHLRGRKRRLSVIVCQSDNEFPLADGPLESQRPKFSRQPHTSLSFIPVGDPAAASPTPVKVEIRTRRGRRFWKKTTSAEAMAGAAVGGLCAVLTLKGTTIASENLASHPPLTRDLPLGLTNSVNNILLNSVTSLGAFAAVLFGVSSVGLALLALKLLTMPKVPPK